MARGITRDVTTRHETPKPPEEPPDAASDRLHCAAAALVDLRYSEAEETISEATEPAKEPNFCWCQVADFKINLREVHASIETPKASFLPWSQWSICATD
jgi:hypothetical protein